jgi:lipid-binding SYLF domain-containing protein
MKNEDSCVPIGPGARIFQRRREMATRTKRFSDDVGLAFVLVVAVLFSSPAWAASSAEQQGTVDKALITFQNFIAKKARFRDHVKDAKALLIVPNLMKAGFILGGSGGSGVLVAWNQKAEEWSQPVFYTVRSVTLGLQIGVEAAEVIMIIWTQKALNALYRNMFKLGGDASVAAGPVGVGSQWDVTGDVLSFGKCKGLFAGLHYDGSMVRVNDDSNKAYYGKAVNSGDIIVKNAVSNPGSTKLREVLKSAVK